MDSIDLIMLSRKKGSQSHHKSDDSDPFFWFSMRFQMPEQTDHVARAAGNRQEME